MNRNRFHKAVTSTAGLVVVLGILVAVHIILQARTVRKDLTEDKLYTLSEGTRSFLDGLDRDITLKLYFSRSAEGIPMQLKHYAQRITDLLREYEANGGGRLVLETYDPRPDSDEEEWAQRYGVAAQGMNMIGGPQIYLGLVAVSGAQEAAIPFLAPSAEPQIEYLVTRLLHEVAIKDRPKIGIMSSLPVMGDAPMPYMPQQGRRDPWVFVSELKKQYEVSPVAADAKDIPADINTLVVVHPKKLSDESLFAIDQFVMRGGRLLAFLDPINLAEQEIGGQNLSPFDSGSDLNKLTSKWGVEFVTGDIVSDISAATQIGRGQGNVERSPMWLTLREDNIDRTEVATASLKILMYPFGGAFRITPTEGITASELLTTSDEAGLTSAYSVMAPGASSLRDFRKEGSMPLAVRLQGRFKSAFPEGIPGRESALAESEEPGVVMLVGDVDMLYDRFCVRSLNIFGQSLHEPLNDNLGFALNMIEQIAGNPALIGLRSRGTYDRPFHKVLKLEQKAQEKWQKEEAVLEAKLQEAQMRLNELQSIKSGDQMYILSPEQKREIEEFRKQQFETQQKLKEVRKNLRQEIEMLGMRIKVLNIGFMPALVACFGLLRGWFRGRKRAS